MVALNRCHHFIQGVDVGLGRGDDDVGIGTVTIDYATAALQTHGDFTLGIGTAGDIADRIELLLNTTFYDIFNGSKCGVYGPTTF